MRKILCIALIAFGFTANAQETDTATIIGNNQVLKSVYESESLSLKEKIDVVNEQVSEGNLSENQAYQVIAEITRQESTEPIVKEGEVVHLEKVDYEADWSKEKNPFEFAMGAQTDTVVKYRSKTSPYLAIGIGNVAADGAFAGSEFGYMRSNSVEWGIAVRRPFSKTNNKFGIRYGLGFKYNGLATTQNREFALAGEQTVTTPSDKDLRKSYAYLRNTYITVPITLDFTTATKTYNAANRRFVEKNGFNFGVGGYVSYNINSKQFLRYENANGYKIHEKQKGDWNVNDFQYGLMAYAGINNLKIIAKYDLNPMFKDNLVDQNYWSLGLQIEL